MRCASLYTTLRRLRESLTSPPFAVLSGVAIFFGVGYGLRVACLNAAAAINEALAARAALLQAK